MVKIGHRFIIWLLVYCSPEKFSCQEWLSFLLVVLERVAEQTYLRFIEVETTAKRARAQIQPGDWSMVKRVDL